MLTQQPPEINKAHIRRELADLQRDLLPMFMAPLLCAPIAWLVYVTQRNWASDTVDLAVLQLAPAVYLTLRLRHSHYVLACWTYVVTLALAMGLIVLSHPHPVVMSFGALVILVSYSLLGVLPSLGAALGTWGTVSLAHRLATASWPGEWDWTLLVLYMLIWGAMWLASYPLRTTGVWALNGWAQARSLLAETQQRRGEVYRALRGLEEATYRIERTNSELLMARQDSETQRAQKERFIARVSHELRGPLNLILGFSRLMILSPERYGEPLPEGFRADVATIYRNSQHLADLVDDILDLSQIEAQRLPLTKDRLNIDKTLKESIATIGPLAERKGLYVHQELADDLPLILGDRVRLRQVALNLLTNAVRFTESGGIVVRSVEEDGYVVVTIQDTGPGISDEDIPRLFREFQQAQISDQAETRAARGTGLGLAISKELVELHGGRIWVESQLGQGTAFHFALPCLEYGKLEPGAPVGSRVVPARAKKRYVLVHASASITRLLARHLDGYQVVGVTSEEKVLALTRDLHPHAIITSTQSADRLQSSLASTHDVPIISFPLSNTSEQEQMAPLLGYLVKPLRAEVVQALMRQVDTGGPTTVLLVDDEPEAVRLMEAILLNLPRPYHILKAYDGRQALDIMQRFVPDVVFMDLVMGELGGAETIAKMRADERLGDVPVVVMSAQDWAGGTMTLGMPLTVRRAQPMSMTQSIRCLQGLLDALDADYLGALVPVERRELALAP